MNRLFPRATGVAWLMVFWGYSPLPTTAAEIRKFPEQVGTPLVGVADLVRRARPHLPIAPGSVKSVIVATEGAKLGSGGEAQKRLALLSEAQNPIVDLRVSPASDLLVAIDDRGGVYALGLLEGDGVAGLVVVKRPLKKVEYDEIVKKHWTLKDYIIRGWDPPYSRSAARFMGLDVSSGGGIIDTPPLAARSIVPTKVAPGAENCVVTLATVHAGTDATTVCRSTQGLATATFPVGIVASVDVNFEYSSLVAREEERLGVYGLSGADIARFPIEFVPDHPKHDFNVYWLDNQYFMLTNEEGYAAVFDSVGKVSKPLNMCSQDGKPAESFHVLVVKADPNSRTAQVSGADGSLAEWTSRNPYEVCR